MKVKVDVMMSHRPRFRSTPGSAAAPLRCATKRAMPAMRMAICLRHSAESMKVPECKDCLSGEAR